MTIFTQPQVLEQTTDGLQHKYHLSIPADLIYFPGHFPGFSILPGVVQVDWAIKLANPSNISGPFAGMRRLKFMQPIFQDQDIRLGLSYTADGKKAQFQYYDDNSVFSAGTLLFGS